MNYEDILNKECKNTEVYLGYNKDALLKINLEENPSIIITGSTGTSKSVMMHQILLQLINKYSYNDLKIVTINPTKVELKPYRNTNYSIDKNIQLTTTNITEITNIISNRINLFKENSVDTFEEYNKSINKLPYIIIAIDEATDLFKDKNSDEKFKWIIDNIKNTGIFLLMCTNDVYNAFFEKDYNTLASVLISFDFVSNDDSKLNNINNCDTLSLDEFIVKINNEDFKYKSFTFNDKIIENLLNKKS